MLDSEMIWMKKMLQPGAYPATSAIKKSDDKFLFASSMKKDGVGFVGFIYFFLIFVFYVE